MTWQGLRVLVADDQAMVRGGFTSLLNAEPDMTVVGEAANGLEALGIARATRPDVVLMDVRMPVMDGLEATGRIRADPDLDGTNVLILTTFDLDEYVFGTLRAGATGFLLKGMEPDELLRAVRIVGDGGSLFAPAATRRLITAFADSHSVNSPKPTMAVSEAVTDREREVLLQVALGLSNAEIAEQLYLSPLTVKTHVSSLLAKHTLRTRVQLVVLAYESRLVGPAA